MLKISKKLFNLDAENFQKIKNLFGHFFPFAKNGKDSHNKDELRHHLHKKNHRANNDDSSNIENGIQGANECNFICAWRISRCKKTDKDCNVAFGCHGKVSATKLYGVNFSHNSRSVEKKTSLIIVTTFQSSFHLAHYQITLELCRERKVNRPND